MTDRSPGIGRTVLARDIMTTPVLTARKETTMSEAAALMLVNRVGSVVIIEDNGDYAGILTERMLIPEEVLVPFMRGSAFRILGHEVGSFQNLEEVMEEVRSMLVGQVMSRDNPTARPNAHITDLIEMMVARNCHHICILEDSKPVGIVSRHDLLRLFLNPAGDPVRREQQGS